MRLNTTFTTAISTAITILGLGSISARAADVTHYLSDLAPASATNAWGPTEKNMSNGEQATGDGRPLTLNGTVYAKGLGVHASSDIRYNLNGACSTFAASIGVDDETGSAGSVVFRIFADGVRLYESGVMTGQSPTAAVNVAIAGRKQLQLVVADGGNGNAFDHADWANARITCASADSAGGANLSEMTWASATNGWGPVERNASNGEAAAGDGKPLTINGLAYPSGLGVHARSEIRYNLNATCSVFSAIVGVDDEVGSAGSVVFEVWADGIRRYQSPVLTGAMAGVPVNVDLAGTMQLSLVVTDAGNGNAFDHADWAKAQVSCGNDATPPTITTVTPAAGSQSVSSTVKITATFSEAVKASTITGSTFTLIKDGSSTPVAATVTYDANTFTATLSPATALQTGASYTATVKGGGAGATDLAANALMTDKAWSFSTSGMTSSQPLVISGQSNVTISGVKISNPNGHCIEIRGNSQNITIQNSEIGPCSGAGVYVSSSSNVIVKSVYIHDTTDNGVTATGVSGLEMANNRLERVKSGLYALSSTRVVVASNNFLNVRGPMPRGQFVQFDKVYGGGNRVQCNVGENIMFESSPEDAINMYQSNGLATDPIQIIGNKIRGGGPSASGGGILLGDSGGSNQIARDNILVDPGQYGMAAAGGTNISILNNQIYGRQQSFTNVGIYVWNQYTTACSAVTVQGNSVKWTNSAGQANPSWNAGNCGAVSGFTSNNWNAPISATIWDQPVPVCQ